MKSIPTISIIIVNHLSEDVLPACLDAVNANGAKCPLEAVVVNNPPERDIVLPDYENVDVSLVPTERRLGFGAACNLGARQAPGEILLFLNPDVVLKPGAIDSLCEILEEDPGAIACGRLVGVDGTSQPSCRKFPTIGNILLSRGSFVQKITGAKSTGYTLPDYNENTKVDSAAAALMMIKKSVFDSLDGFDESFFLYMEDTDLCYRHFLTKNDLWYIPSAVGEHKWGHSTGHYRFSRIIWHHTSVWKYFVKHYRSPGGILFILVLLLVNCCLSLIIELFSLRS